MINIKISTLNCETFLMKVHNFFFVRNSRLCIFTFNDSGKEQKENCRSNGQTDGWTNNSQPRPLIIITCITIIVTMTTNGLGWNWIEWKIVSWNDQHQTASGIDLTGTQAEQVPRFLVKQMNEYEMSKVLVPVSSI